MMCTEHQLYQLSLLRYRVVAGGAAMGSSSWPLASFSLLLYEFRFLG